MRALILAVSATAIAVTAPASAQIMTIVGSLAEGCYHSALARDKSLRGLQSCDSAFTDEALTKEDEFATFVNRGILYMFRKDFDRAQADFDKAIAMRPDRPEPWFNKGLLHLNQGDAANSVALFTRALELGMDEPQLAYYGRALANEDSGNVKLAYADLQSAQKLAPEWDEPARQLRRFRVVR